MQLFLSVKKVFTKILKNTKTKQCTVSRGNFLWERRRYSLLPHQGIQGILQDLTVVWNAFKWRYQWRVHCPAALRCPYKPCSFLSSPYCDSWIKHVWEIAWQFASGAGMWAATHQTLNVPPKWLWEAGGCVGCIGHSQWDTLLNYSLGPDEFSLLLGRLVAVVFVLMLYIPLIWDKPLSPR